MCGNTYEALNVRMEDFLKDLDFPDDRARAHTHRILVGEWISVKQLLTCISSDDLKEIELSDRCRQVIQRSAVRTLRKIRCKILSMNRAIQSAKF